MPIIIVNPEPPIDEAILIKAKQISHEIITRAKMEAETIIKMAIEREMRREREQENRWYRRLWKFLQTPIFP